MPLQNRLPRTHLDLAFTGALSVVAGGLVLLFPEWRSPVRVVLGLVAVLVLPGYALTAALFPRRDDLGGIERTALTLGLSLAVVPLLALVLNYTPWGIRMGPAAITITAFTLALVALAWIVRNVHTPEETFWFPFRAVISATGASAVLVTVVVVGGLVAVASALHTEEAFTEFYILGPTGVLDGYPERLAPGQSYSLTFGIGNHENEDVTYVLRGRTSEGMSILANPSVPDDTAWESTITLTAPRERGRIEVPFELQREGVAEPYRSLRLAVEIGREAGSSP